MQNIVFGFKNQKAVHEIVCNFIILNTKWCIWKHRNKVRYGKENVQSSNQITKDILSLCKQDACTILQSSIAIRLENKLKVIIEKIEKYEL